jgi:hypothetical protein
MKLFQTEVLYLLVVYIFIPCTYFLYDEPLEIHNKYYFMVLNSQECFTNILNETENDYHEISIVRLDSLSSPCFSHFYEGMLAFWANFESN